jgi:hypothetical protein
VVPPLFIVTDNRGTEQNVEPSMNRTLRGINFEGRDEFENANDSIRVNRELDSNDLQHEKHD